MNKFFVQAVKIPTHSEDKYKSEYWQKNGEQWEQIAPPVDADDIKQLLSELGLEITSTHGPWKSSDFVHHVVSSLNDGDTFDDYELVRVELQCLRKKEISQ